jgi:hypothetical protein
MEGNDLGNAQASVEYLCGWSLRPVNKIALTILIEYGVN